MAAIEKYADPVMMYNSYEKIVTKDLSKLKVTQQEVNHLFAFYRRVASFVLNMARKRIDAVKRQS